MPRRETSAMDERLPFVQDVHRSGWSIAELCRALRGEPEDRRAEPWPTSPWNHVPCLMACAVADVRRVHNSKPHQDRPIASGRAHV